MEPGGGAVMSDLIWLSAMQMRRIEPYFPLSHRVPRVDDRRIISGIIFVIRNGLRWRDPPAEYGPPKTTYNSFIRWSRLGVFNKIFAALAAKGGKPGSPPSYLTHRNALSPPSFIKSCVNVWGRKLACLTLLKKSRARASAFS
jgi:putative transposase